MNKLILTLVILCVQRIHCDDYGKGRGYKPKYSEPKTVEKASFGLTVDMEKVETYLKKDPGQLVLVLGDSGPKKPEYGGGGEESYKKVTEYKAPIDDIQGSSGDYKEIVHHDISYAPIAYSGDNSYGGGKGGGYVSTGYSGGEGGYGGGASYGGDSIKEEYLPIKEGPSPAVFLGSGHGSGNGLIVSAGKYMGPGEYSGRQGMAGGYSSKRYGVQRNGYGQRPNRPNRMYMRKRQINDLVYASNERRNLYSTYKMNDFIPNDNLYYY